MLMTRGFSLTIQRHLKYVENIDVNLIFNILVIMYTLRYAISFFLVAMESFVSFNDEVFGLLDFKSCMLRHHGAWLSINQDAKTKHAQLSKYPISIS